MHTPPRTHVERSAILVSANASLRHRICIALRKLHWQVWEASGGAEALEYLEESPCKVFLLDSWLPDLKAQELAAYLNQNYPALDIVQIGAVGNVNSPSRRGCSNEIILVLRRVLAQSTAQGIPLDAPFDEAATPAIKLSPPDPRSPQTYGISPSSSFLTIINVPGDTFGKGKLSAYESRVFPGTPIPGAKEKSTLSFAAHAKQIANADTVPFVLPEMVGHSNEMQALAHRVRLVAPRRTAVLVEGPTGTGKELVARSLHRLSERADRPFMVLNCAAVPEFLMEAELFGHTRGAFTGAVQARIGRIEAAHQGTLFLDEVGEIPLSLQPKLLRFLDSGEVQRVGENKTVKLDVRIIAATNKSLIRCSEDGSFRSDLYYRLSVFTLHTIPLSQCLEDVPLLAKYFLKNLAQQEQRKYFSPDAMECLCSHAWPGNVRELAHVVERAYILAENRPLVTSEEILFV